MTTTDSRKVKNPPIIDAMALVQFNKPFTKKEREEAKNKLLSSFPILSLIAQNLITELNKKDVNSEKTIKETNSSVIILTTQNGEREVILRNDAIIYRDGRQYTSRDEFISHFQCVWDSCLLEQKVDDIEELRFRVINKFDMDVKDIGNTLKILPTINMPDEEKNIIMGSSSVEININSEYRAAKANINLNVIPTSNEVAEIILDIDTYIQKEIYSDFESLKARFYRLSDLKNDIFFANITDANKRFGHEA